MNSKIILSSAAAVFVAVMALGAPVWAATGSSGKTYASDAVECAANPDNNRAQSPRVTAGLYNPKKNASATVSLDGAFVENVSTVNPATNVWLVYGDNTVVVALDNHMADSYTFNVPEDTCALPDTSGNTYSADGTLEYAASGKSYATVKPGCALNAKTGLAQPYVNLLDNGSYLLNVSVNGVSLTQLSTLRPHTPVFLSAGQNVISAANGSLSTDYYVRDGGDGRCTLP